MLLEEECTNRKGLKKKTILRFTPKQEQPIKKILHTKRQAWRKFCSESGTPFGKPFKTTINTSLPPSEIFKAIDVSGSGNSKAIAKKLLEKNISFLLFLKLSLLLKIRHLLKKKLKE
ncbi:hypothetical protein CDAR_293321 [Caerostris darwini]|uniref:Uncharacterized protein n=1 Tax=Caerostris darwini TaxID=1538125 RepID=A0AAV4QFX9_9ARAC|nr:hypothetical protein CDAR_293321 [Caerostris darwini]